MASLLQRYRAGEYEAVWAEVASSGASALREPMRTQALDLCREFVDRCYRNLTLLHSRLLDLGYEFEDPGRALVTASAEDVRRRDACEQELGEFPLVAHTWYSVMASVNFSQAPRQLGRWGGAPDFGANAILGLGSHPVLIVQDLAMAREQSVDYTSEEEGVFLPLGAWASNCEPKGMELPGVGADFILFDDGGGPVTFVNEWRDAFEWGGFPFWAPFFGPTARRWSDSLGYKPDFARLLTELKLGLDPL